MRFEVIPTINPFAHLTIGLLVWLGMAVPLPAQEVADFLIVAPTVTAPRRNSVSVAAGQRMELLSLEPRSSTAEEEVRVLETVRYTGINLPNRDIESALTNANPRWEIVYAAGALGANRVIVNSDVEKRKVVASRNTESTVTTSTTSTWRKSLPAVIVGPATLSFFPEAGQTFVLNFRLRANN